MFTVLDELSWPGSPTKSNEDSCGASADWAWVIDTSIFPGTPPVMNKESDATWLATFVSERLSDLAPNAENGVDLLRHVMEEARTVFFAQAPEERREDFLTWPVGAMTLVHRQGKRLDVWTFGDTVAYLRHPDGRVEALGDTPDLRKFEVAKAREFLEATGATPATITQMPLFQNWLAERRQRQKKSAGLSLLGLDPSAADRLRHETASCEDGTVILLGSDGFAALIDLYEDFSPAELIQAALTTGLEPLAARAREIETQVDPDGKRYPRFKVSDDTTALLLRA
ncbi:protein phosphatase 2C domain-containing protein [Microvirga flavescens]|uniref:protein phosphatase 2C domain-containing protein n=1 Tax=Microvirga flavescens TaxID=2249811 RepID=UPI000DD4F9B4|nr:protein phosphatase 2C domain-containing protein [Microvirga flavescens]